MTDEPTRPDPAAWTSPSAHRALAERLVGAEPERVPAPPRRPLPERRRTPTWAILAALLAVAAAIVAAGAVYVAYDNKTRAEGWEARAFRLERNTEQLNGLLAERSTQLNERTRELNRIAAKVTRQQNALARSESDVQTLSERQAKLAAEKAAVEDSRAALALQATALEAVADRLVACNTGLFELFGYVVEGDRAGADAIADVVASECAEAETSLTQYRFRYG